jgi:hypothetical protein
MSEVKKQTKLDEWLEVRNMDRIADFKLMPIKQTADEIARKVPVKNVPRTGIVQIKGIGRFLHGFQHMERCVFDYNERVMYAVSVGTDMKGNPKFRQFTIDDHTFLDLSRDFDRENYYILLHSTSCQNGPRYNGHGKFRFVDKEAEANAAIDKRKFVRTASEIVDDMGGEQMRAFAPLFQISDKSSDAIIKQQLYEKAEKDPMEFIKRWNAGDRALWQLVEKACVEYVFEQRDNQFFFGNYAMGINKEMCVAKLKEKPEMCEAISDSIDLKMGKVKVAEPVGKKSAKAVNANPFPTE